MSLSVFRPSLLALVLICQVAQPATPQTTISQSILDHLYRLIWPDGRFEGNLAQAIASRTGKAGDVSGFPRLYWVNVTTGDMREWKTARGAVQPAICPDGKSLFYRRGNAIVHESIQVGMEDVSPLAPPNRLGGIEVQYLYACTQNEQGQLALWVESTEGTIRLVRLDNRAASWADIPTEGDLASLEPKKLVDTLQKLRSLRPDGFHAWVRDDRLIGQKTPTAPLFFLVKSPLQFSGIPVWIGDSVFLFVTVLHDEG